MKQPVNLRAERLNRGLTLEAAAERFGCTVSALSLIERDPERRPTPAIAFAIAEEYGFTVTDRWPVPEQERKAA